MANLEDTATITVSSQYSASYDKAYACDNNTGTEWASASDGTNSWIQFTWGTPVTIREIRFVNRPGDPWGIVRLTFSDGTYTDVWTWMGGGADFVYPLLHSVTTTSVRISVSPNLFGGGVNCGFKEIEIRDTYTSTPTTDVTKADHVIPSSTYDNGYMVWQVFDGVSGSQWASLQDGANATLKLEWNSDVDVESVQLYDRNTDRWGTPRFMFDDDTYQDGGEAVSSSGWTTYTLTKKTTSSLLISIASGGSGNNRGLAGIVVTGNVIPSEEPEPPTGRVLGPAIQCMS